MRRIEAPAWAADGGLDDACWLSREDDFNARRQLGLLDLAKPNGTYRLMKRHDWVCFSVPDTATDDLIGSIASYDNIDNGLASKFTIRSIDDSQESWAFLIECDAPEIIRILYWLSFAEFIWTPNSMSWVVTCHYTDSFSLYGNNNLVVPLITKSDQFSAR